MVEIENPLETALHKRKKKKKLYWIGEALVIFFLNYSAISNIVIEDKVPWVSVIKTPVLNSKQKTKNKQTKQNKTKPTTINKQTNNNYTLTDIHMVSYLHE